MSALRWISEGRTIRSARSSTPRTTPSVVNIYTATFTVSEQILSGSSAQLGYTATFMSVHAGKYGTAGKSKIDTTKTKHNPEKANNTKHSKTKLAWFSHLLQHSARKRLIKHGFTSAPTQYRLRLTVFTGLMTQPTVSKHWRRVVSHPDRPQSNHVHLAVLQYYKMHADIIQENNLTHTK